MRCVVIVPIYKKQFDCITLPPITKRNQVFIAMKFSDQTNPYYEEAYKPVIQSLNYSAMRIDEKDFFGLLSAMAGKDFIGAVHVKNIQR